MSLSFKEYLDSKQRLLDAVKHSAIQQSTYSVAKYCKLTLMAEDQKAMLLLRPGQQLIVKWKYDDIKNPTPLDIQVECAKNSALIETTFSTHWKGSKLRDWLAKNTIEDEPL